MRIRITVLLLLVCSASPAQNLRERFPWATRQDTVMALGDTAFVTFDPDSLWFHRGPTSWSVNLLRQGAGAPAGAFSWSVTGSAAVSDSLRFVQAYGGTWARTNNTVTYTPDTSTANTGLATVGDIARGTSDSSRAAGAVNWSGIRNPPYGGLIWHTEVGGSVPDTTATFYLSATDEGDPLVVMPHVRVMGLESPGVVYVDPATTNLKSAKWSGYAGRAVAVKLDESAIEFIDSIRAASIADYILYTIRMGQVSIPNGYILHGTAGDTGTYSSGLQWDGDQLGVGGSPAGALWLNTFRSNYGWTARDASDSAAFEMYSGAVISGRREMRLLSGPLFKTFSDAGTVNTFALDGRTGLFTRYANAAPSNGQLFIGNATSGTWQAATLTAGTNVSIANSTGSITIAADTSTANTGLATVGDVARGPTDSSRIAGTVAGLGTVRRVTLASDTSTTSTSLVSCASMGVNLAANSTYEFDYSIPFSTGATTTGLRLGLNGPSGTTHVAYTVFVHTGSGAAAWVMAGSWDEYAPGTAVAGSGIYHAWIKGTVKTGSTSANMVIRFASETGTAVTLRAGATGRIYGPL